jgi:hypothetical protein
MQNFKIKIIYSDGSTVMRNVEARNFGHACQHIFEDSGQQAFISGFQHISNALPHKLCNCVNPAPEKYGKISRCQKCGGL